MASFAEYKNAYENNWARLGNPIESTSGSLQGGQQAASRQTDLPANRDQDRSPMVVCGSVSLSQIQFQFRHLPGKRPIAREGDHHCAEREGPFTGPDAFINGAIDALRLEGFIGANDWGIARALYRLEGFNGYGYHGAGVNSPYLYGGSTIYGPPEAKSGKYVADHVFNPSVVDTQLGTAVILKALMQLNSSIDLGGTATDGSSETPSRTSRMTSLPKAFSGCRGLSTSLVPIRHWQRTGRMGQRRWLRCLSSSGKTAFRIPGSPTLRPSRRSARS